MPMKSVKSIVHPPSTLSGGGNNSTNQRGVVPVTEPTNAEGPGGDVSNATDAIIEELKTLAKSMLDATYAAHRKTETLERNRSYEALMSAIESRTGGGKPVSNSLSRGVPGTQPVSSHIDPSVEADRALNAEELTQIPASLSPQCPPNNVTSGGELLGSPQEDGHDVTQSLGRDEEDAGLHSLRSHRVTSTGHTSEGRATLQDASTAIADDSDDEYVFDGVRTRMFFRETDPVAYQEVASSAWKPERLQRDVDGAVVNTEVCSDEEDGEDDEECYASVGGGLDRRGAPGADARKSCRVIKVFRVPSFPYGGGVTETQAKELSRLFSKAIRSGDRAGAEGPTRPKFISYDSFQNGEHDEAFPTTDAAHTSFSPKTPYEFVVEVEQHVLFDAAKAREERRSAFRRLVKEGRAPATMGTFNLRIIMDPLKTGFEAEKNFPIVRGGIVADRYRIIELLGKATFSRAVRCHDLHQPIYDDDDEQCVDEADENQDAVVGTTKVHDLDASSCAPVEHEGSQERVTSKKVIMKKSRQPVGYAEVCLKIINNTKDFFDQSLDEIRLLTLINKYRDADEAHVIRLIDAFYYKEHTMLVTELLSDNLYEYSKYNREEEDEFYFTLPRLRRIARQIVEALAYVHSLNLIHADLKPENILFVSHRRCIIKVIDFGSSCYLSDHLSSYIQSRSYRAPEVVFGCDYDGRIDVWSLGAILVELVTGDVLFTSETVPEMLARMVAVCGMPFPRRMLWEGRHTYSYINKFGCIFENGHKEGDEGGEAPYYLYTPVPSLPADPLTAAALASERSESSHRGIGERGYSERDAKVRNGPYAALRRKLAAAKMEDETFISFVEACLTLNHKKRPTSAELLSHPFIADEAL